MLGLGFSSNPAVASSTQNLVSGLGRAARGFTYAIGGRAVELALDMTAFSVGAAADAYARAGLLFTRLVSGVHEVGTQRISSERDVGVPPFYLTKRDHFITSLDGKVDLMLGELNFDRVRGADDDSGLVRGDYPALFYSHGMFMNANFGLFPIDGRGHIPNIDTIRTFLGFFAFLGFRIFYLHMRNCVHIQNRFVRNKSRYVTDPSFRPDLRGVRYTIPDDTTFDVMERCDIGAALRHIVDVHGCGRIVAIAHSLGGDMLYDYKGRHLPYSDNIVGLVPLCTPIRWRFDDETLIRILIKINENAEALNTFLEEIGSDRRANPLEFLGGRVRVGSEIAAGFSPAIGLMYMLGSRIPFIGETLRTLRNTGDKSERVDHRTVGKFIRKCLEPMPPLMIEHFMRIVRSTAGDFTHSESRRIADVLPQISVPVLAVAGERDGLANPDINIAPDFGLLGSAQKRLLRVKDGDHFTTVAGRKAPKAVWFEIARWMHEMGFYPDYDGEALDRIYEKHIAPSKN